MKYYLREMHGSFVKGRLVGVNDDYKVDLEPGGWDEKENILLHIWKAPNDFISKFLGVTDFEAYYLLGAHKTSSNGILGGHHCGKCYRIDADKAANLMAKAIKEHLSRMSNKTM